MAVLRKLKDDVIYINPETMEVECTFNQCIDKFKNEEIKTWMYYREEIKSKVYKCTQCGRTKLSKDGTEKVIEKGKTIWK